MFKIGHSYDIHRLVENKSLIIGGEKIEFDLGLDGHSDADVLIHAVCESLIGAMGKGDIGKLFPDTDPKYMGIDSMILLAKVKDIMDQEKYSICNIDSIIYAQKPNMQKYIPNMEANIAKCLHIDISLVNVKATTYEKLGPIGQGQGIGAECICLLEIN